MNNVNAYAAKAALWLAILLNAVHMNMISAQEYFFFEEGQTPVIGYSAPFYISKNNPNNCTTTIHNFNPLTHKRKYRVAVYSAEGDALAYSMYNITFGAYLTATAGRRFDPPIEFDMIPVTLTTFMDLAEEDQVDFSFASSAVSSCAATELDAQPLVTIVNRRQAHGHEYDLDQYGGVIFTLKDNNEVNSIQDLKDRTIGAGAITAMGGGQSQFYEMVRNGLSYVADPKQVVFTNDETLIVQAVIDGEFEIGLARTDQIERHVDENGKHLPVDTFKIINAQTHTLRDGTLFPFMSSTSLHPEWPVTALKHVPIDVAEAVQEALLALNDHALFTDLGKNLQCETTPALAKLARDCQEAGMLAGFRHARNYFSVRTKQEAAKVLKKDDQVGKWHCIRGETLYDDIECPDDFYKIPRKDFNRSCEILDMKCPKEQYDCYCKPCVHKSVAVDVFKYKNVDVSSDSLVIVPCERLDICGTVEQTKTLTFRIKDNMEREGVNVSATERQDATFRNLNVYKVESKPYTYEFAFERDQTGMSIVEIAFNNEQIHDSPIRVEIVKKECEYVNMEPTSDGECVCKGGTVDVNGNCVDSVIFMAVGSVAGVLLLGTMIYFFIQYQHKKADEVWKVNLDELLFADPVEVIGQGSFGVVLLAEYRGTKVAIKQAVKGKGGSTKNRRSGSVAVANSVDELVRPDLASRDSVMGNPGSVDVGLRLSVASGASAVRDSSTDDGVTVEDSDNKNSDLETGHTASNLPDSYGVSRKWDGPTFDFLGAVATQKNSVMAWLFPWRKKDEYQNRFKETILGTASSVSAVERTTWAILCPWFDEQRQREAEFVKEMRILSLLRHPCITTVMGAVITRSHKPMLIMEYMDYGSLHDLLRNESMHLNGEIISQITRSIGQGLRFLHTSKPPILHGDLKARNILIDSRFRAKLCDFGLSTKQNGRISGTPFWLAPEYLRGETDYDAKCDIYSVGIILFEIYARKNPYEGEDFKEVLRKVCDKRVNKRPDIPTTAPPKVVDLMKRCWNRDRNFRPTSRDLDITLMDLNSSDLDPFTDEQQHAAARKRRSGDMLYELFPKHIANALAAGKKVEPEHHDCVTVIFSDIVRFTDISQELGPLKVSNMLDNLYLAFDKIARRHNIFKVETIGDAYMGVTNLMNKQEHNHVKCAAEFAIDMINEASTILIDPEEPHKGYINIRVGFHSGPVVSNVIGSLNPRYGLFGDTVNTASRMESNSGPNRILCSEVSYKLLKEQAPKIKEKKRGKLNVKGKGEMMTYWVGGSNIIKEHREAMVAMKAAEGQDAAPATVVAAPELQERKCVEFEEEPTEAVGSEREGEEMRLL